MLTKHINILHIQIIFFNLLSILHPLLNIIVYMINGSETIIATSSVIYVQEHIEEVSGKT